MSNLHERHCPKDPDEIPTNFGTHWTNTITKCQWLSVGTDSIDDWHPLAKTIVVVAPGSTTTDLHTIPLANFCAIKYRVCYFNSSEDKFAALELYGSKVTAAAVDHNISSKIGFDLDFKLSFIEAGSDAILRAVNSETFPLTTRINFTII